MFSSWEELKVALENDDTGHYNDTKQDYQECDACANVMRYTEVVETANEELCEECTEDYEECYDCSELYHEDDLTHIDYNNTDVCDNCLRDNYQEDRYGQYMHNDNSVQLYDGSIVHEDEDIRNCDRCRNNYLADDDRCDYEYQCPDCFEEYNDGIQEYVLDYHDNPPVEFFGQDDKERFYGVELEIDNGDLRGFASTYYDERAYLMRDGSLSSEGVEVITHPMTFDEHMGDFWEDLVREARSYDFLSHKTSTCGLHIHINRDALKEDSEYKIIYIVEKFFNKWLRFSRRKNNEIHDWARSIFSSDEERHMIDIKKTKDKKHGRGGRYYAVNTGPSNTIEIRFFKGSLKLNTIKATIQMVHELVNMVNETPEEKLNKMTWFDFLQAIDYTQHDELVQYLNERSLVPSEEEIKEEKERIDKYYKAVELKEQFDHIIESERVSKGQTLSDKWIPIELNEGGLPNIRVGTDVMLRTRVPSLGSGGISLDTVGTVSRFLTDYPMGTDHEYVIEVDWDDERWPMNERWRSVDAINDLLVERDMSKYKPINIQFKGVYLNEPLYMNESRYLEYKRQEDIHSVVLDNEDGVGYGVPLSEIDFSQIKAI